MVRRSPVFLVTVAVVCCLALPAVAVDFGGERLTYEFGWRSVSVATVEIDIDAATVDGAPGYNLKLLVNGKPRLDWIWRVRDQLTASVRAKDLRPTRYFFTQREGAFKLDTEILFDDAQNKLVSRRVQYRKSGTKTLAAKDASGDHYDPISALLVLRRSEFSPGVTHRVKIFDGKRQHEASYTCVGAERITTALGEFDTWKVVPRIERSSGKDTKAEKVKEVVVWIEKAAPHHVVRIESEALWGYIYAELIKK